MCIRDSNDTAPRDAAREVESMLLRETTEEAVREAAALAKAETLEAIQALNRKASGGVDLEELFSGSPKGAHRRQGSSGAVLEMAALTQAAADAAMRVAQEAATQAAIAADAAARAQAQAKAAVEFENKLMSELGDRFSIEDVEFYTHLFRELDLNHDGVLSREELRVAYNKLMSSYGSQGGDRDAEWNRIFREMDLDEDGVVSLDDFFRRVLAKSTRGHNEQRGSRGR
eukprot:TRINITY_DN6337_c0_g1_i2.p1 TRINITY_DN6337_c0_g1~~TRINITY_DN6337_c0_g1_i2.p1  ORF type:complete len:229 (+),score=70.09 TRINITY_DN6337_c0_g1_i2:94-780(+)